MKKYVIIMIVAILSIIIMVNLKNDFHVDEQTVISDEFIAYYVDGEETSVMPSKGDYSVSVNCDKGATGIWDNAAWEITIANATQTGTRCSVSFKTLYSDSSGASRPELYDGLIPIKYDDSNNIVVADTTTEWYNYNDHEWANAMLIDQSNTEIKNKYLNSDGSYKSGTVVSMSDVLQMYVWVPRYRYQLFNVTGASSSPQMINVEFESADTTKSNGTQNSQWLTHPAFTFGDTELNGFWVGKFEPSNTTSDVKIIPNVSSLRNINVSAMFNASRAIESNSKYGLISSEVDTHMMKNMEWGAVAYLTYSKYGRYYSNGSCVSSGCEMWINNAADCTTGCSASSATLSKADTCSNQWNTSVGVNASTTGNIYGIYDMSGGSWEYVMGNMVDSSGAFYISNSGFTQAPESKYYDSYGYNNSDSDFSKSKLGDAIKEVFSNTNYGWNGDVMAFGISNSPWIRRGGYYNNGEYGGAFALRSYTGDVYADYSFRVVLSLE